MRYSLEFEPMVKLGTLDTHKQRMVLEEVCAKHGLTDECREEIHRKTRRRSRFGDSELCEDTGMNVPFTARKNTGRLT